MKSQSMLLAEGKLRSRLSFADYLRFLRESKLMQTAWSPVARASKPLKRSTRRANLRSPPSPLLAASAPFQSTPGKEDFRKLVITEARIEFFDRGVDQKQNEDPNLDSGKAVPGEVNRHVLWNLADGSSGEKVFD
jgi:hypothetical protein